MTVLSVARAVRDPGTYFRFQSLEKQRAYWRLSRAVIGSLSPGRRKAYASLRESPRLFEPIAQSDGFALQSSAGMIARTAAACREAAGVIKTTDLRAARENSRKPYLVRLLNKQTLSADSEIVKLAFNAEILKLAAEYLGCFPTLTYIDLWYSPNDGQEPLDGSQLFHLDHEDLTQLKCFVYIEDIGESQGPLRVLNASSSEKLAGRLSYRTTESEKRVPDDLITSERVVTAIGPKGSMLLVDTSRCFHAGSRGGGRPRFAIVYQYLTPYAFVRRSYRSRIPVIQNADSLHPSSRYVLSF